MKLKLVKIWLCDGCLQGDGEQCETPGCAFFMNRPPAHQIGPELFEVLAEVDERLLGE